MTFRDRRAASAILMVVGISSGAGAVQAYVECEGGRTLQTLCRLEAAEESCAGRAKAVSADAGQTTNSTPPVLFK
jgi:hypothetical protein